MFFFIVLYLLLLDFLIYFSYNLCLLLSLTIIYPTVLSGTQELPLLLWRISMWIIAILRLLCKSHKVQQFLKFLWNRWSFCRYSLQRQWIILSKISEVLGNLDFTSDTWFNIIVTFQSVFFVAIQLLVIPLCLFRILLPLYIAILFFHSRTVDIGLY